MLQFLALWINTTFKREDGQDLAEYALLIALIAIAVIVVIGLLTGSIKSVFNAISGAMANALSGS